MQKDGSFRDGRLDRQSDCHEDADRRRPRNCDPGAGAQIAHPPYDLNPYDPISPKAPKRKGWPRCRRNPLKRLDSRKGESLDFASTGLDFPSLRLGFSFLMIWIFLPKALRILPQALQVLCSTSGIATKGLQ